MRTKLVYDMQFGSTGKGLLIGLIEEKAPPGSIAVSTMAPNAGHTYVTSSGQKFIHSAVPLGALFSHFDLLGIGPGSTVDLKKLEKELQVASTHRFTDARVLIHDHAGVVTERMLEQDSKLVTIGSTMKGSGSAHIEKVLRDPSRGTCLVEHLMKSEVPQRVGYFKIQVVSHQRWLFEMQKHMRENPQAEVVIEGSQGYSLGLNSGFWPYTTYRECTPAQILADAALPIPLNEIELMGVLRTYPIRVANRFDAEGNQIGTSGPGYSDQKELSWEGLGLEPEYTTVTKLQRRVFSFSWVQLRVAVAHTQPDTILCNFMNYLDSEEQLNFKLQMRQELDYPVRLLYGYGPRSEDIRHD